MLTNYSRLFSSFLLIVIILCDAADFFIHGLTINQIIPSSRNNVVTLQSAQSKQHVLRGRIRLNSSSISPSKYQDFEIDGLLDTEARRNQRLKRLEKHYDNQKKRVDDVRKGGEVDKENHNDGESTEEEVFVLGLDYMTDMKQQNTMISDSPAILLQSSAGTGKTTALAGRIAHLIQKQKVQPQNMIILSFTNRDANALKEKALNIICKNDGGHDNLTDNREILEKKLWSGTLHSFAINILRNNNNINSSPLRIISTREMKNRIRQCMGRITTMSKDRMIMYKNALIDAKQSTGTLVQYVLRCLELWKEAGVLPSPYLNTIKFASVSTEDNQTNIMKDDFIELAMRLGIPQSAAVFAYEISGDYQTLHASAGTSDPSDVATIAYEYLLNNPKALTKIRSKLHQVILDEYQDMSVSQHRLLRLMITGHNEEKVNEKKQLKFAVLTEDASTTIQEGDDVVCYHVPNLCAAGDSNQSIYGWRGAAPSLTVEGFRRDFPQGIVVPLTTSYRLPRNILNAANVLLGQKSSSSSVAFDTSPAAIMSKDSLVEKHAMLQLEDGVMNESKSSVIIHGLWDKREEAKFIAQEIRRRAKERIRLCVEAVGQISNSDTTDILDSSDVAIMVRSSNEMEIFKQALEAYGIPYNVPSRNRSSVGKIHYPGQRKNTLLSMKPCKIITMHQAKGDEFDDVYLASWSEGNFPHPSSLETNRLHEERRIAYVALTRARQRVMITYPYMERKAFFGPNGERKDVTEQVKPSRFLYDLMPSRDEDGSNGVFWNNSVGFKEVIAGKDLPSHFANSYKIPDGYRSNEAALKSSILSSSETTVATKIVSSGHDKTSNGDMKEVKNGLKSIFSTVRGSCRKYKTIFRQMLQARGFNRGRATILKEMEKNVDKDIERIISASPIEIDTRPISRCTAAQLGLYLAAVIQDEQNKEQ